MGDEPEEKWAVDKTQMIGHEDVRFFPVNPVTSDDIDLDPQHNQGQFYGILPKHEQGSSPLEKETNGKYRITCVAYARKLLYGEFGDSKTDHSTNGEDTLEFNVTTELGANLYFALYCALPNDGVNKIFAIELDQYDAQE